MSSAGRSGEDRVAVDRDRVAELAAAAADGGGQLRGLGAGGGAGAGEGVDGALTRGAWRRAPRQRSCRPRSRPRRRASRLGAVGGGQRRGLGARRGAGAGEGVGGALREVGATTYGRPGDDRVAVDRDGDAEPSPGRTVGGGQLRCLGARGGAGAGEGVGGARTESGPTLSSGVPATIVSPSIATERPSCSLVAPSEAVSFAVSVRAAAPVRAKV